MMRVIFASLMVATALSDDSLDELKDVIKLEDDCADPGLELLQYHSTKKSASQQAPLTAPAEVERMRLCAPDRMLDFGAATVLHSNLGGHGPDSGDENLVYGGVLDGIDLVVTAISHYTPNDINPSGGVLHNGEHLGFGVINIASGSHVDLLFKFVYHASGEGVVMPPFVFALFDSDQGFAHESRETYTVKGFNSYRLRDDSDVSVEMLSGHGHATFTSTLRGGKSDNPLSPSSLTKLQEKRMVSLLFEDVSAFHLTLGEVGYANPQGRNVFFSGSSTLVCGEEAKCSAITCPAGMHQRTYAEFVACGSKPCSSADVPICCYQEEPIADPIVAKE